MPRVRQKTRVAHLADALTATQRVQDVLGNIDLRETPAGPLRELVQAARGESRMLGATLADALRADVPPIPSGLGQVSPESA